METTALIAHRYGQSDVLAFTTFELPPLGVSQARIAVSAAGINPVDARRMTGEFRHGTPPLSFGTEFAGTVVGLNGNAGGWDVGDEVLALVTPDSEAGLRDALASSSKPTGGGGT